MATDSVFPFSHHPPPPAGEFVDIERAGQHACGVRADGSAACRGTDAHGELEVPSS